MKLNHAVRLRGRKACLIIMTENERLKLYTSIVPNERQLKIQQMPFYAFVHYGPNTFTGREWGMGKDSPGVFNPKNQDVRQWCAAIKSAGMKGVVLTCKHHDGFCLWQTKTTEYSIKNSPYKNGRGDVVREVSEACREYGLKFGIYLSPWDRNSPLYGTPEYNDFYIAQLTELLTNYGEIFMLWLDGACGASADGIPKQKYDFERIWSTALKLQPGIVMSGCAPDIRWVGNESGKARKSEWNVVPKFQYDLQNIAANCQQDDDLKKFQKRCRDVMVEDIGSREFLSGYDEFMWYPAEVDVSIRTGWFYHPLQSLTLKSLHRLMEIYYGSVGSNCLLILNVPPNKHGLLGKKDVARLAEIGRELEKENDSVIKSTYVQSDDAGVYEISFERISVDRLRLAENTTFSQRVEEFEIYAGSKCVYKGTVIGFSKIAIFDEPVETDSLKLVIRKSRLEPHINKIEVCKTGAYRL